MQAIIIIVKSVGILIKDYTEFDGYIIFTKLEFVINYTSFSKSGQIIYTHIQTIFSYNPLHPIDNSFFYYLYQIKFF